jgi:hypothetical protein
MDEYQVRTWEGWHHHMALTLIAVWFLLRETHRGQQWTPALTLPQVRYGLSVLLLGGCPRNYQADSSSIVAGPQLAGDNRCVCIELPLFPTLGEPS